MRAAARSAALAPPVRPTFGGGTPCPSRPIPPPAPAPRRAKARGDAPASEDSRTAVTVLVALAANLVIAVAKALGGFLAGSPALLSEAAHSVADSLNEVFLLASLKRSKRAPDARHPFGYGKERYFWSLLAAVGIFVMGGCFSFFQGIEAMRSGSSETRSGYIAGLIVLGVALIAEGSSLVRALVQVRGQARRAGRGMLATIRTGDDPALRTVLAEDSTACFGVLVAMAGMGLHMATGDVRYEAWASLIIGALLVYRGLPARQGVARAAHRGGRRPGAAEGDPGVPGRTAGDRHGDHAADDADGHAVDAGRGPYRSRRRAATAKRWRRSWCG